MTTRQDSILVLDDEHNYAKMLMDLLVNRGYSAEICTSPTDALKILHDKEFSLVVADFKMPEMDGAEFLTALRKFLPEMPVIMVSGYMNTPELVKVANIGVTLVLEKPFDSNTFFDYVRRFVSTGSSQDEQTADAGTDTLDNDESEDIEASAAVEQSDSENIPPMKLLAAHSRAGRSFAASLWREYCRSTQIWIAAPQGTELTLVLKEMAGWSEQCAERPVLLAASQLNAESSRDRLISLQQALSGFVVFIDYTLDDINETTTASINAFIEWLRENSALQKNCRFVHGLPDAIIRNGQLQHLPEYARANLILLNALSERPLDLAHYAQNLLSGRDASNWQFADDALPVLLNYEWPGNYDELKAVFNRLQAESEGDGRVITAATVIYAIEGRHGTPGEPQGSLALESFLHRQQVQFLKESVRSGQSIDRLLKDVREPEDDEEEGAAKIDPESLPFYFPSLLSSISHHS